jgi:hypothetical protein
MMIGSYCLGLMGLQLMPGFGMLAFAAAQQVWAAAGAIGAILLLFAAAQGVASDVSKKIASSARVAAGCRPMFQTATVSSLPAHLRASGKAIPTQRRYTLISDFIKDGFAQDSWLFTTWQPASAASSHFTKAPSPGAVRSARS